MTADYLSYMIGGGGLVLIVGLALLAAARAADRRNYIVERATPMSVALVNERDDVWLRGIIECDAPLSPPHFGTACVVYRYCLEERVRRTRHTKHGTSTSYSWETREKRSESVRFRLRDGGQAIEVDGTRADFKDLTSTSQQIGSWRHTLSYLPLGAEVSAVGSVGERRVVLEPYANIPLIVTPRPRARYIAAIESAERAMRFFGFAGLWVGAGTAAYGALGVAGVPASGSDFSPERLTAAAGAAAVVFVPLWAVYIFNTFVTYRVRAENAWRQVDVDLKMRYDLIPQLASAVEGFLAHEREVMASLVSIRSEAMAGGRDALVAAEVRAAGGVRQMRAAVERYPDLKGRPAVARLMRELTAVEDKIAHGRAVYNEAVTEYNTNVMSFPRVVLARMLGFGVRPPFAAVDADRAPAAV